MNQRLSKKIINISVIIVIIVAIIFTALMMVLKYEEKGETNMPFYISKISIISTVDGKDVEDANNRWNLEVSQNNDIYIYIQKNDNYKKTETIKNIVLNNFTINLKPTLGDITIYEPSVNDVSIFKNKEEYIASEIIIQGDKSTSIQSLKISNQGGIVAFRCANNNLATYISNDDEELNYKELLKKLKVNEESVKAKVSFDITIELNSNKKYKAQNINLEFPVQNIVEEGTTSLEEIDLQNIIFKRIENKN